MSEAGRLDVETRSSLLATALRSEILDGTLPPGERLHLDVTRRRFDVSFSPLREALSRLSARGLVTAENQRGHRVAPVSVEYRHEVVRMRAALETLALHEAMTLDPPGWRDAVVAASTLLQAQDDDRRGSDLRSGASTLSHHADRRLRNADAGKLRQRPS